MSTVYRFPLPRSTRLTWETLQRWTLDANANANILQTKTRIVLADSRIHILGAFKNIGMAREAVVSLILGKPPSKVYGNLRNVAARMKERF